LAQDSKTWMRVRTYKGAHQKPAPKTALEPWHTEPQSRPTYIRNHPLMPTRKVIAVIDDSLPILGGLSRLLASLGHGVELYVSAKEFLDAAKSSEAIGLLVDIQLGESCGIELAQKLADAGFTIPIIFMTANDNATVRARVTAVGCVAYLVKPFSADTLIEALTKINPQALT
jgi:FixJ family two-component response regulator